MEADLMQLAATGVLCLGRVSGLLVCSPVLGSSAVSAPAKASLALAVALLVYPAFTANALPVRSGSILATTLSEFAVGAAIGLAAQLVFEGVQLAGQTMGLQMGLSLATVFDPTSNADSPVIATLVQMLATLMFLALNAHVFLLRAVANSYVWLPPGAELRWAAFAEWGSRAVGGVLNAGVQLAAPVVLATMCVDVVLGIAGKASPQLPVLLLGISVKAVVGLGVLLVSLRFWPDLISHQMENAMGAVERLLHAVH